MHNMNFIRPVPPHKEKELRRWMLVSALLIMSLLIGGITISGIQWKVYRDIQQEKNTLMIQLASYDQIMNRQHEHTKQHSTLQQKLQQLQVYTNQPKNPIDIITTVQKILGTVPLQSLTIDNDHFELKGSCLHAKQATQLVGKLNSLALCNNAQLHAIASGSNNTLEFVIKGSIAS